MTHRSFWQVGVILVLGAFLLSGVVATGQTNEEILASLDQVLQEVITLRQSLWDLESSILASVNPDLLALEAANFEYERQILELTGRFLAIREAMHGIVPPLVIDEKIALVKSELAAAWLENSMIEGKLSIKKKELLALAVANDPPRSCFTVEAADVVAGAPVQFRDCSSDLEGKIASWAWTFGDVGTSVEASPAHVYATPGRYEVSLVVTDEDGAVARFSAFVDVQPALVTLSVLSDRSLDEYLGGSPTSILVIFDTSSSMDEPLEGSTRLAVAKRVLADFLDAVPEAVGVGLRIFGSCERSTLVIPVKPADRQEMRGLIAGVQAKGATPLALSLGLAAGDLAGLGGAKAVLLITDGQESCGGDPVMSAMQVMSQVRDLRIHVVGLAVQSDPAVQRQLAQIAEAGGGMYLDAASSSELAAAFRAVSPIAYRVLDARGVVVAAGVLGDTVPPLAPGPYTVEVNLPTGAISTTRVDLAVGAGVVLRVGYSAGAYFVRVE